MTYADFDFYQNNYKGIIITDGNEYAYFAERAGDELALFVNRIPKEDDEAQNALKRCACRITDIFYGDYKCSQYGVNKMGSESVSGYYSVSYVPTDNAQIKRMINSALALYLGRYILGGRNIII